MVRSRIQLIVTMAIAALAAASSATAEPLGQITEFSAGLNPGSRPTAIASAPDGDLWFTDAGSTPAIGRITPQGQITEFSDGLNPGARPNAIVAGPDGDMWFTDLNGYIGRVSPQGELSESASGLNPGSAPNAIAVSDSGNVWFTDTGTTPAIGRINAEGQISEFSNGVLPHALGGIAAGPNGNMWFTDWFNGAVEQIMPDGHFTGYSTSGLNPGSKPTAIAPGLGRDGDHLVWFTDVGSTPAIGRDTEINGSITAHEYAGGLPAGSQPDAIAWGPDATPWFSDGGVAGKIGHLLPSDSSGGVPDWSSAAEHSVGLNPGSHPTGIAVGIDGDMWFTDDGSTPAIGRIGTGAAPAVQSAPAVNGTAQVGSPVTCQSQWTAWSGITPQLGYQWLLDGAPIAFGNGAAYTPTATASGHQLSCTVTADYGSALGRFSSTSAATVVQPQPPGLHAAFSSSPSGELCGGQTVTFDAGASTAGNAPITTYRWTFDTDLPGGPYAWWSTVERKFVEYGPTFDDTTGPIEQRTYAPTVLYSPQTAAWNGFSIPTGSVFPAGDFIVGTTVTLTIHDAAGGSDSVTHTLSFFDSADYWNGGPTRSSVDPCPHVQVTGPPAFAPVQPTLVKSSSIEIPFGCVQAQTCGGLITLSALTTRGGSAHPPSPCASATTCAAATDARVHRRPVVVARARFAVPQGQHEVIAVTLNKRGRALARAGRLHELRVSVTTVAGGRGKPQIITRVVTVKARRGR